MDRRNFIKSLSVIPFIPSINWGGKKPYFQYYFGPFGSGKTPRLISDAIEFLEKYPVKGLYLVSNSHQIDRIKSIMFRENMPQEVKYRELDNMLCLPSGGTLKFGVYMSPSGRVDSSYKALWSDQLDLQATNDTIHEQHIVSIQAARMIQEELGLKPIELGNGLEGFFSR